MNIVAFSFGQNFLQNAHLKKEFSGEHAPEPPFTHTNIPTFLKYFEPPTTSPPPPPKWNPRYTVCTFCMCYYYSYHNYTSGCMYPSVSAQNFLEIVFHSPQIDLSKCSQNNKSTTNQH